MNYWWKNCGYCYTEVDVLGTDIDARGVLLDAQFTGGIPTASSVGVNGVVSDLLISSLTGGEIETTHIMIETQFHLGSDCNCGGDRMSEDYDEDMRKNSTKCLRKSANVSKKSPRVSIQ